ncbi:5-guanidino-2-oxopentanoate decarboxylase [Rhodobacter sp. Har01]|uniref:5-guanidino-2-oxopentanoate decarboxylase n=1 Tax=Rhodobacter sp. Har01 TaxID=2883999 RepID=UPI001D090EF5|nr:5-guanidino-2-oxopentanoate decarboxylase [Rhodobacter sp. Har01]MCB6178455.1 5-guanidino-2-oxopentanoate decarboxylase [Rhodobacter sp. Har01]
MTTVGERLVQGLAARGVEVVFGIPGVHTIELYRGLAQGLVRHVTPRHEQGAGFMADGYARVTGRPGVAFVITGPGLTNTLTAMAQARADSIPMLVISGVNRRASLGRGLGLLHELPDQAAMVRALCPTETLTDPAQLGPALDRAFAAMLTGRPGPAHLEIPTDVMGLPCPDLPPPAVLPPPPTATPQTLAEAAALLARAQRPVILIGGGARFAEEETRALAEALDAPVIQTANARGLMHGHPLTVPASPSLEATRDLIRAADAILALGTELGPTDYDMYVNHRLPDLSGMIRVDLCARQLARHPARLTIQAEARSFAAALLPLLSPRHAQGAERAATARKAARAELATLHPAMPEQLAMVEAIRDAAPGSLIVGDSTQPVYAANLFYDHDRPRGWFNAATGYGALGYGPGAAIGAAIAAPGTPVTCLIGDGGLGFDPAELRVAVDEGLPVTFVVWNNAAFREIAEAMTAAQTPVIGCSPSPFDMSHLAAACGLPFARVPQDPKALAAALRAPCDGPRLIEVQAR